MIPTTIVVITLVMLRKTGFTVGTEVLEVSELHSRRRTKHATVLCDGLLCFAEERTGWSFVEPGISFLPPGVSFLPPCGDSTHS